MYFGILCVRRIDRDYRRGSDCSLFVAGVIDDQPVSWFHVAQVLEGYRIRDSVPNRGFVALQIGEGISARFSFQKIVHEQVVPRFPIPYTPNGYIASNALSC